ncbi:MAG: FmdB family zinc ribbon protein [Bacillota bacterium]
MPNYEYRCKNCGVFERFQRITEDPLKTCPMCNSQVQRLISKNVHVMYKGSGFYTTDNRGSDYKSAQSSEGNDTGSKAS